MNAIAYCLSISVFIFSPGVGSGRRLGRYIYVYIIYPSPLLPGSPLPPMRQNFHFPRAPEKKRKKQKNILLGSCTHTDARIACAPARARCICVASRFHSHTRACTRAPTRLPARAHAHASAPRYAPPGEGADSRPAKPPRSHPTHKAIHPRAGAILRARAGASAQPVAVQKGDYTMEHTIF